MAFKIADINPLKAAPHAQDVLLGGAAASVLAPYVQKFVIDAKFLKKADGSSILPDFVRNNVGAIAAILGGLVAYLGLKRTKMASRAGGVYVGATAVGVATFVSKFLEGKKLPGLSDTVAVQLGSYATLIDERPPALAAYDGTLVDEPGYRAYAQDDDDDGMGQLAALAMHGEDEDYSDLDALVNIET